MSEKEQRPNSAYRLHGIELPTDPAAYREAVQRIAEERRLRESEFWAGIGKAALSDNIEKGKEIE